jgi:murein DD-endopeptidase MepM/ murein hydrolase activator NlpD
LTLVEAQLAEREKQIASMPAIAPVKGILTSGFGHRRDPITGSRAFHSGVDIATAPGRPVLTSADGVVIRTGRMSGLGLSVYVSHGYGLTTRYGHLSRITVEPGQRVGRGDEVGRVGSTGRATGFHLHYEVLQDGRAVDPIAYLLESPSGS